MEKPHRTPDSESLINLASFKPVRTFEGYFKTSPKFLYVCSTVSPVGSLLIIFCIVVFFHFLPGMGSRPKNFSARLPAHEPENEPEII